MSEKSIRCGKHLPMNTICGRLTGHDGPCRDNLPCPANPDRSNNNEHCYHELRRGKRPRRGGRVEVVSRCCWCRREEWSSAYAVHGPHAVEVRT